MERPTSKLPVWLSLLRMACSVGNGLFRMAMQLVHAAWLYHSFQSQLGSHGALHRTSGLSPDEPFVFASCCLPVVARWVSFPPLFLLRRYGCRLTILHNIHGVIRGALRRHQDANSAALAVINTRRSMGNLENVCCFLGACVVWQKRLRKLSCDVTPSA